MQLLVTEVKFEKDLNDVLQQCDPQITLICEKENLVEPKDHRMKIDLQTATKSDVYISFDENNQKDDYFKHKTDKDLNSKYAEILNKINTS